MSITLDRIKAKTITVGVMGLSYEGLTLSQSFSKNGIKVIGFDQDIKKVSSMEKEEHLSATSDFSKLALCDAVIFCREFSQNISLKALYQMITPFLKAETLVTFNGFEKNYEFEEKSFKPFLEDLRKEKQPFQHFVCYTHHTSEKEENSKKISHSVAGGIDQKSIELAVSLYALILDQEKPKKNFTSPFVPQGHAPLTLERIFKKQITVGIVGLGYVGLPLSLVFSTKDVNVIGFDVDQEKIASIMRGKSYIHHIDERLLKEALEKNKILATTDFSYSANCDVIIICVPTPLDHHLEPDLKYIVQTCESIAPYLSPHTLVSLESTTWPGTTEEVVKPILEEKGHLKLGENLYLAFSPEREDPGNKSFSTKNIPKLVGGADEKSLELAAAVYELSIEKVVRVANTRVAEAAKLFENIFRSVNIALVNELKMICDPMGIDVWEVIKAASTKPFGFMSFWPGPGLGGHCIPIDPFYLTWKAKEFGISTRFIELAGEINRGMPKYVISKIQDCLNSFEMALNGSKILILGLAYKSDVDDMRESPSLELIKLLEEKGASVDYHDPYIEEIGPNREYQKLIGKRSQPLSKNYDCFVLATKHNCFSSDEILSFEVPIIDTRNFFPKCKQVVPA